MTAPIVSKPTVATKDWKALCEDLMNADQALELFNECKTLGELDSMIIDGDREISAREYLTEIGKTLRRMDENPVVPDTETVEAEIVEAEDE
jgi:hypothetical protein